MAIYKVKDGKHCAVDQCLIVTSVAELTWSHNFEDKLSLWLIYNFMTSIFFMGCTLDYHMSHIMRKPVFGALDQVRLKTGLLSYRHYLVFKFVFRALDQVRLKTGLLSYRHYLESSNFGYSNYTTTSLLNYLWGPSQFLH